MLSVPSKTHALGYFYFVLTLTSLPLAVRDSDCMLSHVVTVPVIHKFIHHNVWPIIFLPLFLEPIGLWMLLIKHHCGPIIQPFRPTIVQPTTSSITTMVFRMFSKVCWLSLTISFVHGPTCKEDASYWQRQGQKSCCPLNTYCQSLSISHHLFILPTWLLHKWLIWACFYLSPLWLRST